MSFLGQLAGALQHHQCMVLQPLGREGLRDALRVVDGYRREQDPSPPLTGGRGDRHCQQPIFVSKWPCPRRHRPIRRILRVQDGDCIERPSRLYRTATRPRSRKPRRSLRKPLQRTLNKTREGRWWRQVECKEQGQNNPKRIRLTCARDRARGTS